MPTDHDNTHDLDRLRAAHLLVLLGEAQSVLEGLRWRGELPDRQGLLLEALQGGQDALCDHYTEAALADAVSSAEPVRVIFMHPDAITRGEALRHVLVEWGPSIAETADGRAALGYLRAWYRDLEGAADGLSGGVHLLEPLPEDRASRLPEDIEELQVESSRVPEDPRTSEVLRDLLALVDRSVTLEDAEAWTTEEQAAAYAWASATHLAASGNDGVQVPEEPAHVASLPRWSSLHRIGAPIRRGPGGRVSSAEPVVFMGECLRCGAPSATPNGSQCVVCAL